MGEKLYGFSPDGLSLTPRIERMRARLFATPLSISADRACILTGVYRDNEAQPFMKKRALGLKAILDRMQLYIGEDELLVGGIAGRPKCAPIFPEYSVNWLQRELNDDPIALSGRPGEPFSISPEDRRALLEDVIPFWKGRTQEDYLKAIMPGEMWDVIFRMKCVDIAWMILAGDGHTIPDYGKVLRVGFGGIMDEARQALEGLDNLNPESVDKAIFLQSVLITSQAVIDLAHRYAALALEQAEAAPPQRRAELTAIAAALTRVPEHGARSFREALQSLLLAHLVVQIEGNGHSISIGRLDQMLLPYYRADIEAGFLDEAQAFELLNCLWLKLGEVVKLRDWEGTKSFVGNPLFQNVAIGGQTAQGGDAVNDLSYLCLYCTRMLKVSQPSLTARWHINTSPRFVLSCAETIATGVGMPAMFNDEAIIPAMLSAGYEYQDAINYGITGCVEPSPHGLICGRLGGCFCNLAKILEVTLNDGRDPATGMCPLKGDGDLSQMTSYTQLEAAFKKQLDFYLNLHVRADNMVDDLIAQKLCSPYLSSLIGDCISRGREIKAGGAKYDFTTSQEVGLAVVANALAALKKLVFEEKALTPAQVKHALDTNFDDQSTQPTGEAIRLLLVNRAPKYGNDDDTVDRIAAEVMGYWSREKRRYHNSRWGKGPIGCTFVTSTATVSSNVPMGALVGATPDGRRAGEPLSEGVSAYRGTDTQGPTALINSVAKLPNHLVVGGQLLNVKINPAFIQGEWGLRRLVDLIRGFFVQKGFHIQFNVVSTEILRRAQREPEKFRDLIVRVAGYSAYFVMLDKSVQEDIIRRTEYVLG